MTSLLIAIAAKGEAKPETCLSIILSSAAQIDCDITVRVAVDKQQSSLKKMPGVELFSCPPGTSILKLWGKALANSESDYVAVLDANNPPSAAWLDVVCKTMNLNIPLFCGAVECSRLNNLENSLGYLVEYAQFHFPFRCFTEFPGNNIVFKSNMLDSDEKLLKEGFFKTFTLWRLEKECGVKPEYIENMSVNYQKKYKRAAYFRRRTNHGRCFGATRVEQDQRGKRWFYIASTPLLPALRVYRIYKWVNDNPEMKHAFFNHFFTITAAECAWSFGELMGYCFGDNGACNTLD